MNVALDGGENDRVRGGLGFAGFGDGVAHDVKAEARRLRRADELGKEDFILLEQVADRVQRRDQVLRDNLERSGAAFEQTAGCGCAVLAQSLEHRRGDVRLSAVRAGFGSGRCVYRYGIFVQIVDTARIAQVKQIVYVDRLHHLGQVRVDDREIQSVVHRKREEMRIDLDALRQTERDVGDAETGLDAQLLLDAAERLKSLHRAGRLGGDGQGQTVDGDAVRRDAVFCRAGDDFAGDCDTALDRIRNTVLIQRQTDEHRAVLGGEREDGVQTLFLTVDRVDHRDAVVAAQGGLQHLGNVGVQLERQVNHALQFPGDLEHCLALVDARQTDVDIQNIRTGIRLLDALIDDIVQIMGTERSLKALLSGRVDALADDADAICRNKAGAGAQRRDVFFLGQAECALGDTRADLADIVGIGAAAAAENGEAEVEILVVGLGKFSGGDVIRQGFGGGVRQTGVCLDDHRNGTAGAHALRNRQDLLRTERAVDADGTRAQTFEGDGGGLRRDAEERASGGLKCQRRKHRQVALLACGEHGGLDFEQI